MGGERPEGRRPGGRTARTRAAVFAAVLDLLVERSADQISMEEVAQRAGVHKTTVYRRWGTRDRLVAEALADAARELIPHPDTGDVAGDFRALARMVLATLHRDGVATAMRSLVASGRQSPEVAAIARRFWAARQALTMPVVERAVARGELPAGTDAAAAIAQVTAPLFFRGFIMGQPLSEDDADQAAEAALVAARAGVFVTSRPPAGER